MSDIDLYDDAMQLEVMVLSSSYLGALEGLNVPPGPAVVSRRCLVFNWSVHCRADYSCREKVTKNDSRRGVREQNGRKRDIE